MNCTADTRKKRLKNSYVLPLTESLIRFDFEVDQEDESLVGVLPFLGSLGVGKNEWLVICVQITAVKLSYKGYGYKGVAL